MTIAGSGFGATQGMSTVTFNGIAATATSWSADTIEVSVPSGATTGNVVVRYRERRAMVSASRLYPAPSITSLSVTSGVVGISVTITGTNFGAIQDTGTVSFNGTDATPTSWSATSIVVTVPAEATTGNVVVSASGVRAMASISRWLRDWESPVCRQPRASWALKLLFLAQASGLRKVVAQFR